MLKPFLRSMARVSAENRQRAYSVSIGLIVIAVYLAHLSLMRMQFNDDAFITFRYAHSLAAGQGPYYNVGEHVEGYTNFSMMLIAAAAIRLLGPEHVEAAAKLICALAGVLTLLATWRLCTRWLRRLSAFEKHASPLGWSAAGLVAVNSAFAFNSTTGLETTLLAAAITLGLAAGQAQRDTQRWRGAGLLLALAALTRPEGIFLCGAILAGRLVAGEWRANPLRRLVLVDACVIGAVVLAHSVFRWFAYDGEFLPNTYYAKSGGMSWATSPAAYAGSFAWFHLGGPAALACLLPLVSTRRAVRVGVAPALCVVPAGVLAIFLAGPDWMGGFRLLVPYFPAWSALAVCGLAAVLQRAAARPRLPRGALLFTPLVLLALWETPIRAQYCQRAQLSRIVYRDASHALAQWLRSHSRAGQTVALNDIGVVGYECDELNILDMTGLTDRTIAKSPGQFLRKQYDPAYVLDKEPEFIVIVLAGPAGSEGLEISKLSAWTPAEENILGSALFAQRYFRPRTLDEDAEFHERLAGVLGAEVLFEHPVENNAHYFLVVYRRTHMPAAQ